MFGFSSKNPHVIKSDFESVWKKIEELNEDQRAEVASGIRYLRDNMFRGEFALKKEHSDWFVKYFEDIVNENKKSVKRWKLFPDFHEIIYKKTPEILTFELIHYYVKAVRYDDSMVAIRHIIPRIVILSEVEVGKIQESVEQKIIIKCRKCSQKLRVRDATGVVKCPSCGHSWLREKE